ncbi:PAS domain-containing protein [Phenylobacterium sp.]|jgi:PAS domain S-box-containing protein|uniref:PAS domain-containing protein n=1 Tax=Phenylobacterium sp. TaxID=1871053 RepID=UPI002F92C800
MSSSGDAAELPFRQLAQHLPTMCWISDAEGVITWVNDAWLAYTGMGPAELAGGGLASLHDPEVLPRVRAEWAQARAASQPVETTFPLRGRDGVLRPFLTRVVPLPDGEGRITRWFGTNTDISEQAEAEARARRSEASLKENLTRLRLATEAGGVGVWEWRLDTNEMVYSPEAKAICGFPQDGPVTYEMVAAATHPEDFPHTRAQAERALDPAIRDRTHYHYRIVRPSGEVRWVTASGEAVFEERTDGVVATRYVGTLIDVTEQQRIRQQLEESEARLRESEAQLRLATDAAEVGLWDVDPLSDTLFWPPRVKAMFGISPDAPVSMSDDFFPCLHPEDRDRVGAAYAAATDPEIRALYDVEYRTIGKEDGVVRWVAAKGRALFNEAGECYRVIGTAMDVTERRRNERAVLEQARSLQVLNETGAALAAELDLQKVVQMVTDAAVRITGAEFGAFFYNLVDEAGESYTLYTLSGVDRSHFEKFPMPRNTQVFGPTFAGEGVVRSDDITKDPRYGQNAPYKGMPEGHLPVRSYLAVPVASRSGEVIGGLFFGHSTPAVFTDTAEELVRGVAGQAAVAIDNAQLYRAAQREIEQRRRVEERQLLLINELNHRVKNTLATVQSIVAQTSRTDRSSQEVRVAIEGRLLALSAAHDLLTRHSWEGADLREVAQRAASPFSPDGEARIRISGPAVPLAPQQALALSMAIHELATNAAKYGALSVPGGHAELQWSVRGGQLQMHWGEHGGPEVKPPAGRGFGSRLLERGLAADLQGSVSLSYPPEGVRCTIAAPLAGAPKSTAPLKLSPASA